MCYFQAHISIESLFLSNVKILSTPKLVNLSSNVKFLALKKVNPPFTVLAAAQGADGKNGGRSEYCRWSGPLAGEKPEALLYSDSGDCVRRFTDLYAFLVNPWF